MRNLDKINYIFVIILIRKFFKITNNSYSRLLFVTKLIKLNSLKQKPFNYTKIIRVDTVLTEWKCKFLSIKIIRLTKRQFRIKKFLWLKICSLLDIQNLLLFPRNPFHASHQGVLEGPRSSQGSESPVGPGGGDQVP